MGKDTEIREFLRRQRASLSPDDVGLPAEEPRRRRVPGLRREEVARLAGVSTDYYTRLEQGRDIRPSEDVLAAIARALRLTDAERAYLFELVRPCRSRPSPRNVQRLRPNLHRLLSFWTEQPALIIGRRTDVLATNAMARALLADFDAMPARQRNFTRWLVLDEHARDLYRDWEQVTSEMVAKLRMDAGRYPDDPRMTELVGELAMKSPEFRVWWADHRVMAHSHGIKRFSHPVVGDLDLDLEALTISGDADQTIFLYFAEPGSPSAETLGLLASWAGAPTRDTGPVRDKPRSPSNSPVPRPDDRR
ncbi:MAG TPA: helix-turn-helix transcriptional regulator [Amycolatopsis sp.]|jgi:transcriptional regulator with XRE-family HTH domain|nr:helix-turn-helix transcriptional regulator [Amycolatopsis sp.]